MTKFCPQCGASVNEAQRFCNKCGTSLQPTTPYVGQNEPPTMHQTYTPPSVTGQAPYANPPSGYQAQVPPPVSSYQTGQLPSQMPGQTPMGQGGFNTGLSTNQLSALCYLLPLIGGILALVIEPYNRDRLIRFHAWQSILFTAAWFVFTKIAIPILHFTFLPDFLVSMMGGLAGIGFFVGWIYLMVQTWQGIMFKVPLIGDVAEQQVNNTMR